MTTLRDAMANFIADYYYGTVERDIAVMDADAFLEAMLDFPESARLELVEKLTPWRPMVAAVQAAKRMRDDLSALELHGDGAHDDSCSICRAIEDFDAAFRDAGIHLAKNVTDPA